MGYAGIVESIRKMTQRVQDDEERIGVYSTGERIAVALVLDRPDLVKSVWGTMLEAVERLGPEWFAAALEVQRQAGRDENGKLYFE